MEPPDADVTGLLSDSDNEYDDHDPDSQLREDDEKMGGIHASTDPAKKKYDPKDPMRPRRKKARRACYACQRAHLTCGMSVVSFLVSLHPRQSRGKSSRRMSTCPHPGAALSAIPS